MSFTLPLGQMTNAEKLEAMEALWTNLTRDEQQFYSPAWHEAALRERQDLLDNGQETPIDWELARRELWEG